MNIEERIAELLEAISSQDTAISFEAARELGQINEPAAAPLLLPALESRRDLVRQYAMVALVKIGEPAIPQLTSALESEHARIRFYAADALGSLKCPATVPALLSALKDEDGIVGERVVEALLEIGEMPAHSHIPDLIAALGTDSQEVKEYANSALAGIGAPAVPLLIEGTLDSDQETSNSCSTLLVNIGVSAVPALIIALKDVREGARLSAAQSLSAIGCVSSIPALIESLFDESPSVRKQAIHALKGMAASSVGDMRLLAGAIRSKKKQQATLEENETQLEFEISSLLVVYRRWSPMLSQKCIREHQGMQEPPRRFRNPPRRFGRNNISAEKRMAVGGGRA
jgi:HEAT repeat protein